MKTCDKCNERYSAEEWICSKCGYAPKHLNGFVAHAPDLAFGGGGFKAEYFASLATVESSSFWFRARNEIILWALKKYKPDAASFLEVGCGTGFVLSGIAEKFPTIALSGSEIFVDGLPYAAERLPHANLMQMDARQLPFSEEFDVVGAFDVLEHIQEDEDVLAELHKALRPGGIALLSVPQHPWLWSATDDYACHVRRYTRDELTKKCIAKGFSIERSTSFVSFLLPAMIASRRKKKAQTAENDVMAELRLPPLVNAIFYSAMWIEQQFIRWGINLPCGGSRLVVARKVRDQSP